MRRIFIFCISFLVLFSCTDRMHVPSDIIPIDSMKNIYREIIEADQYSSEYLAKSDSLTVKSKTLQLYVTIFRLHHISEADFRKSLSFYSSRPDLNRLIFDSLFLQSQKSRNNRRIIPPILHKK